ncbi:MAG: DUF3122 domain-containing protein [Cyanobacterium sp.]
MLNSISVKGFKINLIQGVTILCLWILLIIGCPFPAFATVTQIEEYPGQMLYQSRQNLQDQMGNYWRAIAFKRIHPEGSASISLRLIGFPGGVSLDHTQPLILITDFGQTFSAKDISDDISQNTSSLGNVGEYDFNSVLPQLQESVPLTLSLSTIDGESISLSVPSFIIEEWKSLTDGDFYRG